MWYELNKKVMEHFIVFPNIILYGEEIHSGYDDLQNLLDITSHENPLLQKSLQKFSVITTVGFGV